MVYFTYNCSNACFSTVKSKSLVKIKQINSTILYSYSYLDLLASAAARVTDKRGE